MCSLLTISHSVSLRGLLQPVSLSNGETVFLYPSASLPACWLNMRVSRSFRTRQCVITQQHQCARRHKSNYVLVRKRTQRYISITLLGSKPLSYSSSSWALWCRLSAASQRIFCKQISECKAPLVWQDNVYLFVFRLWYNAALICDPVIHMWDVFTIFILVTSTKCLSGM